MKLNELEIDALRGSEAQDLEIPDSVRTRLEHTYSSLAKVPLKKRNRLSQRLMIASCSVAAAGLLILGAGFFSPVIAESLKQIPIVNHIYKWIGDAGLIVADERGLTTTVNESISINGVTMGVTKVMYDGVRISIVLTQEAPGGKRNFTVNALVNGEEGPLSFSTSPMRNWGQGSQGATLVHIGHTPTDGRTKQPYSFPDAFELTLQVRLQGMEKEMFVFKLPIRKNAPGARVWQQEEAKVAGDIKQKVHKLELTPVTTELQMQIQRIDPITKLPREFRMDVPDFQYVLEDDGGHYVGSLSYSGSLGDEVNHLWTNRLTFDPIRETAQHVVIKSYLETGPFKRKGQTEPDRQPDVRREVTEMPTVDKPIVINVGEEGYYEIFRIDYEQDKTTVYYQIKGIQAWLVHDLLWVEYGNGNLQFRKHLKVTREDPLIFMVEYPKLPAGEKLTLGLYKSRYKHIKELDVRVPLR